MILCVTVKVMRPVKSDTRPLKPQEYWFISVLSFLYTGPNTSILPFSQRRCVTTILPDVYILGPPREYPEGRVTILTLLFYVPF